VLAQQSRRAAEEERGGKTTLLIQESTRKAKPTPELQRAKGSPEVPPIWPRAECRRLSHELRSH